MIPLHWLLRAKRWAANPPPLRRVIFVLAIIAACLVLAAIEWIWGMPSWMQVNSLRAKL